MAFVNTVDLIGDSALTDSLIDRSIAEIADNIVTSIGDRAFSNCSALSKVSFPEATSVGGYGFQGCSKLAEAEFQKLQSIGDYAFYSCSNLGYIDLSAVTQIGTNAFYGCYKLQISEAPFARTSTSVTGAFYDCRALTTANFPLFELIPQDMFSNCYALKNTNFPSAKEIRNYAFYYCNALETVDLPSAEKIYKSAFGSCSLLSALILRGEAMCTLVSADALTGTKIQRGTGYIYVPRALLSDDDETKDYRRASNWSNFSARFRALEDYTVDGTTTGELDPVKIAA